MTDDTLRDGLEVALCHALCTSDTADHDPTVHRAVNAALNVWGDEHTPAASRERLLDITDTYIDELGRESARAIKAEAERDVWEEHAQDSVAERDELQARINRAVNMCSRSPNNGRVQEIRDELNPTPASIDLSGLGTDVLRWSGIGWSRATITEYHDNGTVTVTEADGGEFTVSPTSLIPRKDTTDE